MCEENDDAVVYWWYRELSVIRNGVIPRLSNDLECLEHTMEISNRFLKFSLFLLATLSLSRLDKRRGNSSFCLCSYRNAFLFAHSFMVCFCFSDFNPMFNWAFRTTENVVKGAVNFSAPIVNKFDAPINYVDQTFVKGLDKLEATAPIIKEQPAEILNQAKAKVMDVVQPQINKVCGLRKAGEQKAASLKDLSYNKAKEVLATSYGSIAVTGIDSTAILAERLLDSFFPKTEEDDLEDDKSMLSDFLVL